MDCPHTTWLLVCERERGVWWMRRGEGGEVGHGGRGLRSLLLRLSCWLTHSVPARARVRRCPCACLCPWLVCGVLTHTIRWRRALQAGGRVCVTKGGRRWASCRSFDDHSGRWHRQRWGSFNEHIYVRIISSGNPWFKECMYFNKVTRSTSTRYPLRNSVRILLLCVCVCVYEYMYESYVYCDTVIPNRRGIPWVVLRASERWKFI